MNYSEIIHILGTDFGKSVNIKKYVKKVIKENKANLALDSDRNLYYKKEKEIKKEVLNSGNFDDIMLKLDISERCKVDYFIKQYENEYDLKRVIEKSVYIDFKTMTLVYERLLIDIHICCKIYDNGACLVNIHVPLENKSAEEILKIQSFLLRGKIEKVLSSNENNNALDNKVLFFDDLCKSIINMITSHKKIDILFNRNETIINQNKINKSLLDKLFYATYAETKKEELKKDYRKINDYCLYVNEFNSLIISDDLSPALDAFPTLDNEVMYSMVLVERTFLNLEQKKVSIREAKSVKNYYKYQKSNPFYIKYVEQEKYYNDVLSTLHYNNYIEMVINSIDDSISEYNNIYEHLLEFLGVILAMPTLYDKIAVPFINNTLNKEIIYPYDVYIFIGLIVLIMILIKIVKFIKYKWRKKKIC